MTPEQKQTWNEIIEQCQASGEYYTKGINCGTAKRRTAILAVNAELKMLRQAVAQFTPNLRLGERHPKAPGAV